MKGDWCSSGGGHQIGQGREIDPTPLIQNAQNHSIRTQVDHLLDLATHDCNLGRGHTKSPRVGPNHGEDRPLPPL
jgi:hypothetical protein